MLPGQHTAGALRPQAAQLAAQHLPPLAVRNTEQAMPQGRRTWVWKSLLCSSTSQLCAVQQETVPRPPRRTNSMCSRDAGVAPPWSRDVGCGQVPRDTCSLEQQSGLCIQGFWGGKSKGDGCSLETFWPMAFGGRILGPKQSDPSQPPASSLPSFFLSWFPPLATENSPESPWQED